MIPVIASAVMGIFAFGSYQLAHLAVKSNAISTLFAMMIAVVVYGVLLIKLGALSAAELKDDAGRNEAPESVQKTASDVEAERAEINRDSHLTVSAWTKIWFYVFKNRKESR